MGVPLSRLLMFGATNKTLEAMGIGDDDRSEALERAAERVKEIWEGLLTGAGSGKHHTIGFRTIDGLAIPIESLPGYPRRSSAPGEPPAEQSGALKESLKIIIFPKSKIAKVQTDSYVASIMEFGAGPSYGHDAPARNVVIKPRPHRAVVELIASQEGVLEDEIQLLIDKSSKMTIIPIDLGAVRQKLLTGSAIIGNLQSLGINAPGFFTLRDKILGTERFLGDVEAFADGKIGGRAKRRVAGRQLGKIMGRIVPSGGGGAGKFGKRVIRNTLGGQSGKILQKIK